MYSMPPAVPAVFFYLKLVWCILLIFCA